MYRLELWGGNPNGAVRYYKEAGTAIREGKKYVRRNYHGVLDDHAYAEIYKNGKLILTIDSYAL